MRVRNVGVAKDMRIKIGRRQGFTLIELLVVISIIALLLAILMPALSRVKDQAKKIVCGSNLGQAGKIWTMYAMDNKNFLPPGPAGNNWDVVFPALHDIFTLSYDSGEGKMFYCPSYTFFDGDGDGKIENWRNPMTDSSSGKKYYPCGYWIFTNPAVGYFGDSSYSNLSPDGVEVTWSSLMYDIRRAGTDADKIVPARKITDTFHVVANGRGKETVKILPGKTPMLFDATLSVSGSYSKNYTRHIDGGKPAGRNAVMLDGHVDWRGGKDIKILRNYSPWEYRY